MKSGFVNVGNSTAFGKLLQDIAPQDLYQYLKTYNIQWIITNTDRGGYHFGTYAFEKRPDFMSQVAAIREYKIFRVRLSPTFFLQGTGHVTASWNRLQVQDASSGGIVLKYHWMQSLKTDPPLNITPFQALDDPMGLIQVDNGDVHDFLIYNSYEIGPDASVPESPIEK